MSSLLLESRGAAIISTIFNCSKYMYGLIYKTTNLVNGKIYIGQTIQISDYLKGWYIGSGKLIIKAIKKYSRQSFKSEILCYCETQNELDEKEKFYIKEFNSVSPNGYNLEAGGNGKGEVHQSTRDKLSKAIFTAERRKKIGLATKGRTYSLEKRLHLREKNLGKSMHSEEFKIKLSQDRVGEGNPMKNKKHSEETKALISYYSKLQHKNNPNMKGYKIEKKTCEYCNNTYAKHVISRYHGINCKKYEDKEN